MNEKQFNLSASEAGRMMGVSCGTMLRLAQDYPEQLPHLQVASGKKRIVRFCKEDIHRFIAHHKSGGQTPQVA